MPVGLLISDKIPFGINKTFIYTAVERLLLGVEKFWFFYKIFEILRDFLRFFAELMSL